MMGGETAQNRQSINDNKEYCITLHLVGCTWKNTLMMHGHMNVKCFGQFVCPSSGAYSLYTQQWYMSYRFVDNFRAGAYAE
jgi:hypothetical protein